MRALLAVVVLAGCAPVQRVETSSRVGPSQVLEVLVRHGCPACHGVEVVFGSSDAHATRGAEPLAERGLPTLASMERFRASWLRAFLSAPCVVRPNLPVRMPPPALTPREIDTLVAGWHASGDGDAPAPARDSVARGEALFAEKGCGACHALGARAVSADTSAPPRLRMLAPDLGHASERLPRAALEAFIFDPSSVKPTSQMPRVPLTESEARALADLIAATSQQRR